jgi:hypothetical protein
VALGVCLVQRWTESWQRQRLGRDTRGSPIAALKMSRWSLANLINLMTEILVYLAFRHFYWFPDIVIVLEC